MLQSEAAEGSAGADFTGAPSPDHAGTVRLWPYLPSANAIRLRLI